MRVRPREALWFSFQFVCAMSVLMLSWPWLIEPYARLAAFAGNRLAPESEHATIVFSEVLTHELDSRESEFPLLLTVRPRAGAGEIKLPIDLRTLAFLPTATLLALAFATPIWRTRRAWIPLFIALLLLKLFLVASIATPLVLFFANPKPLQLVTLAPGTSYVMNVLYRALVAPPGMSYAIPGVLWLCAVWLVPVDTRTAMS